jgi:hypothetical protein
MACSLVGNTSGVTLQGRDGELRFLDKSQASAGALGTPYAFLVKFEQMDARIGFQRQAEERPVLDRERFTADAHLQLGSEENLLQSYEISMSVAMTQVDGQALLDFLGVRWSSQIGSDTATWRVKGTPATGLVSTKSRGLSGDGAYSGGRVDSKGSLIQLLCFANPKKVAVDAEVMWSDRLGTTTTGYRIKEVNFDVGRQELNETADNVFVRLTGMVYGETEPITQFTPAKNVLSQLIMPVGRSS